MTLDIVNGFYPQMFVLNRLSNLNSDLSFFDFAHNYYKAFGHCSRYFCQVRLHGESHQRAHGKEDGMANSILSGSTWKRQWHGHAYPVREHIQTYAIPNYRGAYGEKGDIFCYLLAERWEQNLDEWMNESLNKWTDCYATSQINITIGKAFKSTRKCIRTECWKKAYCYQKGEVL